MYEPNPTKCYLCADKTEHSAQEHNAAMVAYDGITAVFAGKLAMPTGWGSTENGNA